MRRSALCGLSPPAALRWLIPLALAGCGEPGPDAADPAAALLARGRDYVEDAASRRAALEAALVEPGNGYSRLRLERYTEAAWGALPVWAPAVRPILGSDVGAADPVPDEAWAPLAFGEVPWTPEALRALGEEAFFRYPVQVAPALRAALAEGAPDYGLWREGERLGAVWVALPDGRVEPAFTCATCHATPAPDGGVVAGRPNAALDFGAMRAAFYQRPDDGWGPGRLDVTGDGHLDPVQISDLRPARLQTHLHRAATLRNDLVALAIRVETLLITASGQAARPPREVAFALAWYLWGMADTLPPLPGGRGREVFQRTCASCHAPPALTGPPRPLAEIGTADRVARSPERGTGHWRVPSLRGVGDRGPLLSDGAVGGLDELLDPGRTAPGHRFGLDLDATDRAALLEFLRAL